MTELYIAFKNKTFCKFEVGLFSANFSSEVFLLVLSVAGASLSFFAPCAGVVVLGVDASSTGLPFELAKAVTIFDPAKFVALFPKPSRGGVIASPAGGLLKPFANCC